jgi:hypothetical protein
MLNSINSGGGRVIPWTSSGKGVGDLGNLTWVFWRFEVTALNNIFD